MENNIKMERKGEKLISFFKKYGYFIVAGLIVSAITLTVLLTTLNVPIHEEEKPIDTGTDTITFINPLLDCTILNDYSIDKLVYNSTLGWLETHSGIDLASTTSTDVLATCAGKVSEVYTNSLQGTVVIIKHADKYSTLYGSLGTDVTVKVGDNVIAGQKIGTISTTAGNESLLGAHLHFELLKDNSGINPNDYLDLGTK
ncbi:MAG: M23 family metallopeptidase [Crenarchaeota archaeon]|nr:M23 family metallopeptidase [Thermoproteota archaeon]